MNREIFKSTILDFYPSYTKKEILKQAVKDGLIINNKKHVTVQNPHYAKIISGFPFNASRMAVNAFM